MEYVRCVNKIQIERKSNRKMKEILFSNSVLLQYLYPYVGLVIKNVRNTRARARVYKQRYRKAIVTWTILYSVMIQNK